jgi:rare lipoprotein A
MATFYSSHLAGHRTASGERYNPGALTAAHKTLPLGTVVRVTRVDGSGAPVLVRINDRGPYAPGRIIDLSLAAARRLQMLSAGVVRVRVEVVSRP